MSALGQTADNRFTYGAAAGMIQLGSSGLFRTGPSVYDAVTTREISGIAETAPGDKARGETTGAGKARP